MKAYKHLVKHALAQGCLISVWDGEVWEVRASKSYKEIIACIESVEEAQIRIIDKYTTNKMGWARVSAFGLDDDETVIDNTDNDFMNSWDEAYNLTRA
jgi:hypothetical protein